jgi:iron complex transport system substrate-binding protein
VVVATVALFASAAVARPQHIMSLNLCTDELLLDLVPAERIASVTYLSRSPSNSFQSSAAARVPVNYGSAEEVLAQRPDLVLAGTYTTTATRLLLKKIRTPMVQIPPANSFAEIRDVTRMVARAVGEERRGQKLIARMDATLQKLAATKPHLLLRVAAWNGAGGVPGRGTLFDAVLTEAGGINIASTNPGATDGRFGIEQLLFARPDVLLYGSEGRSAPSLRTDANQHPVLLKAFSSRRVAYPEVLYSCGVPEIADAAKALRKTLLRATTAPGGTFR